MLLSSSIAFLLIVLRWGLSQELDLSSSAKQMADESWGSSTLSSSTKTISPHQYCQLFTWVLEICPLVLVLAWNTVPTEHLARSSSENISDKHNHMHW